MIIFIRGKAATGKSLLANQLKTDLDMDTISKDSVFDILLQQGYTWQDANCIAYDRLASIIQEKHDKKENLIVDLGLAHTEYFDMFLSKMTLKPNRTKKFLFVCSHEKTWEDRILKRVISPAAPNQIFRSVNQAKEHYKKYTISAHEDEFVVDSVLTIADMKTIILDEIKQDIR